MKLTIELVPQTAWGANLRSRLKKKDWDKLRKESYRKAEYECEVCGEIGDKWPVECHEIWEYDDKNHVQKLVGLISLCPDCHRVKHIGYAKVSGHYEEALAHLQKVNGLSKVGVEVYIRNAFRQFRKRSEHLWTLDLSWLEGKGVKYD